MASQDAAKVAKAVDTYQADNKCSEITSEYGDREKFERTACEREREVLLRKLQRLEEEYETGAEGRLRNFQRGVEMLFGASVCPVPLSYMSKRSSVDMA